MAGRSCYRIVVVLVFLLGGLLGCGRAWALGDEPRAGETLTQYLTPEILQAIFPGADGIHGRRCSANSIIGGGLCKNPAAKGFTVCWQHGAKAELTRRAIVAAGDTPMAYAARKRKQAAHRARAAQYRSGERVAVKESFERAELRWLREQRQRSSLYDEFSERSAHAPRPLKPLYPV